MSQDTTEVDAYLKFVAAVRIAYGIGAFVAPGLTMALIGAKDNEDSRQTNAFLGSRDIAIGVHSLVAIRTGTQRDAVLVNQWCEIVDTVIVGGASSARRR